MPSQPAVLIADDEAICVAITTKLLEQFGVRVITASDGVEAVRLYEQHKKEIVVVLLDIQMPRMSGIEAFRRIKKLHGAARVVIVSGYVTASSKDQLDRLGPAGYIEKPLTPEALSEFLEPLLNATDHVL